MFAIILLTSSCASVPSEPFKAFSESLVELNLGTDKALAELIPLSETRFKHELTEELGEGGSEKLESLQILTTPSTPFTVKGTPLFLKTEQFKIGISQVTGSLVAYSNLLQQLAAPELLPQKTFDDLATDLNANAFQAISTMNTDPSDQTQSDVALFSQLAIAATQAYLQSERKDDLINALEQNQLSVDKFAEALQRAILIIAQSTVNEYQENYKVLSRKAIDENTRNKAIVDLIALDRNHIRQIKVLQALHQAYGEIPAAHAELAKIVAKPEQGLSTIINMVETGKRLQAGYDQSLAASKAASTQAKADKASAQATSLEAQAESAALRFSIANVAAVKARIEADADPGDEGKKKVAEEREKIAKELQEEATEKKANAQKLRGGNWGRAIGDVHWIIGLQTISYMISR